MKKLYSIFFIIISITLASCGNQNNSTTEQSQIITKTIEYPNGDIYSGEFKNDKKHGEGVYTFSNNHNIEYRGEFKNDKFHGEGTLTSKTGVYKGMFKNGKKNGYGSFSHGPQSTHPKDRYVGEFKDDKYHGYGSYYWGHEPFEKEMYMGYWENNKRSGYGVNYYNNGNRYYGNWKNDKWHGYGTHDVEKGLLNLYGLVHEGYWENGVLVDLETILP